MKVRGYYVIMTNFLFYGLLISVGFFVITYYLLLVSQSLLCFDLTTVHSWKSGWLISSVKRLFLFHGSPSLRLKHDNFKVRNTLVLPNTWLRILFVYEERVISCKAILFLFFGLQIRQLYFKQIEMKMKSCFLGFFFIADRLKKGKIGTFHSNIGLFGIKITRI